MHRIVNGILFLFMLNCALSAQDAPDFKKVDAETYRFYTEKNWDSLIEMGESAIKQGIDYYYLRMRIGIAWYEKSNYVKSSRHFIKALDFNNREPVALEYLYYSYLFTGRIHQANLLSKEFSPLLKEKTGIRPRPVDELNINFFYNHSGTEDMVSSSSEYFSTDIPGYQIVTQYFSNFNFSLRHKLGPRFTLLHSYTYLNKVNLYHFYNGSITVRNPDFMVKQHQYYISVNTAFKKGWGISPTFHFINTGYPYLSSVIQGGQGRPPTAQYIDQNESSLLAGLMVTKLLGPVDLRIYGHGSNLNNRNQLQGAAGLTYYPFGNLDVYVGGDFVLLAQNGDSNKVINPIGCGLIGFSIARKVWFEISTSVGEMNNYAERNGYLIYNSADILRQKYDLNIAVPLSDKGSLIYAGVRYSSYSSYLTSLIEPELKDLNELSYNSLSFYGGILWKF